MSKYNYYECCWFVDTNNYPFHISVADANGNVVSKVVLKPSEFFTGLGLTNPRNYYMEQIYSD